MAAWAWATGGDVRVDTAELVAAAGHVATAEQSLAAASASLWSTQGVNGIAGSWLHQWDSLLSGAHGEQVAALTAIVTQHLSDLRSELVVLADRTAQYSAWLTQAALIFAAAEDGARGFVQSCQALGALGCSFPMADEGAASWAGSLSLIGVAPTLLSEFRDGSTSGHPLAATTFQMQLEELSKSHGGVQGTAAQVARWWNGLGNTLQGRSDGVMVVGADGAGLWSSKGEVDTALAFALTGAAAPLAKGAEDARRRLWDTRPKRGSNRRLLDSLSLDAQGRAAGLGSGSSAGLESHTGRGSPAPGHGRGGEGLVERIISSATTSRPEVATPLTAAALLSRIAVSGSSPSVGEVQILRHNLIPVDDGSRLGSGAKPSNTKRHSWSIVVRGTQEWAPGSTNPQDMQSNFETVAGSTSDQKTAVQLAMKLAGIPASDPVEFVGHSQGGAVALELAADMQESGEYNVVSVMTAGSPTGRLGEGLNVPVLNFENLADIVPALDGSPAGGNPNQINILFDARDLPKTAGANAHSLETYVAAAARLSDAEMNDPISQSAKAWGHKRNEAMQLSAADNTEILLYRTTRVR